VSTVFISYRRSDSAAVAGRLYDALATSIGPQAIFMDIDTLRPGQDFVDMIEKSVSSADVLIAVIGPSWLTAAGANGMARLQDPTDIVRREVATALRLGRRVIPVLVSGAPMPPPASLPPELQALTRRNALSLSHEHWGRDVDALVVALGGSRRKGKAGTRRWISAAVGIGLLILAVGGVLSRSASSRRSAEVGQSRSLAVLPFQNLGDSGDNARFTDGTTAEIRGKLTRLSGLQVIGPASSNQYKPTDKSWKKIGQELGVRYLLTGAVNWNRGPSGEVRVRVSPSLIEASTGALKWQEPFDAALTDVFEVQTTVAERVMRALDLALSDSARRELTATSTQNLAAYDAFLKGEEVSHGLGVGDPAILGRAAAYYAQAVGLDSNFAPAWARLSRVHSLLYGGSTPTTAKAQQALYAAQRAVALAPNRSEGHAALGVYYLNVARNSDRGLDELEQARKLAPNDAELMRVLAFAEYSLGHWEPALAHYKQAVQLDPRSQRNAEFLTQILIWLRRYPEARQASDRALALAPDGLDIIENSVMLSLAQGDLSEARAVLAAATKKVDPVALVAFFAYYFDLYWPLDERQQRLLISLSPRAFDGDRAIWGLALSQTYFLRGDLVRTRAYADSARAAFEEHLKDSPNDAQQHVLLGLALAFLGRKAEAVQEGLQGQAIMPRTEYAAEGAYIQHQVARIYLLVNEPEKALDQLEPLLQTPYYLSPGWLRIDPTFDRIRSRPRFQRLLQDRQDLVGVLRVIRKQATLDRGGQRILLIAAPPMMAVGHEELANRTAADLRHLNGKRVRARGELQEMTLWAAEVTPLD
jgi:TolB-like protein/Flp pilus assembly protein TadD